MCTTMDVVSLKFGPLRAAVSSSHAGRGTLQPENSGPCTNCFGRISLAVGHATAPSLGVRDASNLCEIRRIDGNLVRAHMKPERPACSCEFQDSCQPDSCPSRERLFMGRRARHGRLTIFLMALTSRQTWESSELACGELLLSGLGVPHAQTVSLGRVSSLLHNCSQQGHHPAHCRSLSFPKALAHAAPRLFWLGASVAAAAPIFLRCLAPRHV